MFLEFYEGIRTSSRKRPEVNAIYRTKKISVATLSLLATACLFWLMNALISFEDIRLDTSDDFKIISYIDNPIVVLPAKINRTPIKKIEVIDPPVTEQIDFAVATQIEIKTQKNPFAPPMWQAPIAEVGLTKLDRPMFPIALLRARYPERPIETEFKAMRSLCSMLMQKAQLFPAHQRLLTRNLTISLMNLH